MARHKEHAVFAAIVTLVIGAITAQMLRADAVTLAPTPAAVVKTIALG